MTASQIIQGLYAITDPLLTPGDDLFSACQAALEGGARILQYRDKQACAQDKLDNAIKLQKLCEQYRAIFIINDDPDLALASQANGVHIGQKDAHLQYCRTLLPNKLIGVSCHGKAELAAQAENTGADYIALGRFFDSQTKPNAPAASTTVLKQVRQNQKVPIVAIGGLNPHNAALLIESGADAIAAIHGLFASNDPATITRKARAYSRLFD